MAHTLFHDVGVETLYTGYSIGYTVRPMHILFRPCGLTLNKRNDRQRSPTAIMQTNSSMAHCSVWSNATSASRNNCKTTFPTCSPCSRTRASLDITSGRSWVSMPRNTTFSRNHASYLWVTFVVSISCSPHHCYDVTSHTDSWWIECTKSSSMNLTPAFDSLVVQIVVRTTSDTDPNGFRPNVATNTNTNMSVLA